MLVVRDRYGDEVTRHFWRDRELACLDESVVRRFKVPGIVPIKVAGGCDRHEQDQADGDRIGISTQEICTGLVVAFVLRGLLAFRLGRQRSPVFLFADVFLRRAVSSRSGGPLGRLQDLLGSTVANVSSAHHDPAAFAMSGRTTAARRFGSQRDFPLGVGTVSRHLLSRVWAAKGGEIRDQESA
jgi:hypothetical protein